MLCASFLDTTIEYVEVNGITTHSLIGDNG